MNTSTTQPSHEPSLKFLHPLKFAMDTETHRLEMMIEIFSLSNSEDDSGKQLCHFSTLLEPVANHYRDFLIQVGSIDTSGKSDAEKITALKESLEDCRAQKQLDALVDLTFYVDDDLALGKVWYLIQPVLSRFAELRRNFFESLKDAQKQLKTNDAKDTQTQSAPHA